MNNFTFTSEFIRHKCALGYLPGGGKSTCHTAVEGEKITHGVVKGCSWHVVRPAAAASQQCAVFVATRQMCLLQTQMLFTHVHPGQAGKATIEVAVSWRRHRHSERETERVSLCPPPRPPFTRSL